MSDILSQAEVDALLAAVSTGAPAADAEPAGQAEPAPEAEAAEGNTPASLYDFRRPDRVSKDQMRTFQSLHENFARLFSTTLTNFLRTLVEVDLVSVDQLTYAEFIMSISNPSCIYLFNMAPLEGTAIFEVNPSLVFFIVDRLFGGQGRISEQNRELSQIERSVLNRILDRGLADLKTVWEHIGEYAPKVESYETNPQFVQIAPPGETVILISLEVHMQNASGLMSICFPYLLLESVITRLSGESWISGMSVSTEETRACLERELQDVDITLSTIIGKSSITIRDLLKLTGGDVLCLDKPAGGDLLVQIDGKTKMAARSGLFGRKKAIKITRILEKEVPGCHD